MNHAVGQFFVLAAFAVAFYRDRLWAKEHSTLASWLVCYALMIMTWMVEAK